MNKTSAMRWTGSFCSNLTAPAPAKNGPAHRSIIWTAIISFFFAFAVCTIAAAQSKKVPRIGYLASDAHAPTRDAFRQGLKDFAYVEGQSIQIEWRFAEDKPVRFPEFAAELARLKVDAIVSGASVAVAILQHATSTIPIVMATYGGDPVADGVVTSFAKPGGNITGVISLSPELSGKQLELSRKRCPNYPDWR